MGWGRSLAQLETRYSQPLIPLGPEDLPDPGGTRRAGRAGWAPFALLSLRAGSAALARSASSTAFVLSLLVSSERFLTSRPVIVPSLMFWPVSVTAA